MKKLFILPIALLLGACVSPSVKHIPSDEEIAQRRAEIRAMERQDYQDARRERQDAIEDLGTMDMNRAKAINKAYENRSKQKVYIIR